MRFYPTVVETPFRHTLDVTRRGKSHAAVFPVTNLALPTSVFQFFIVCVKILKAHSLLQSGNAEKKKAILLDLQKLISCVYLEETLALRSQLIPW